MHIIHLPVDDVDFEQITRAKGDLTWLDFLLLAAQVILDEREKEAVRIDSDRAVPRPPSVPLFPLTGEPEVSDA